MEGPRVEEFGVKWIRVGRFQGCGLKGSGFNGLNRTEGFRDSGLKGLGLLTVEGFRVYECRLVFIGLKEQVGLCRDIQEYIRVKDKDMATTTLISVWAWGQLVLEWELEASRDL